MLPLRCPCVYPAALCVFGLTAMPVPPAAIVALPPNLTSTFQQRVPWAVPGVELPQELADMRPIPFEFGEDIKQKERPTYYWAFRIMQNLVRRGAAMVVQSRGRESYLIERAGEVLHATFRVPFSTVLGSLIMPK